MSCEHPASGLLNAGRMMYVAMGRVSHDQPKIPGRSIRELVLVETTARSPHRGGIGGGRCLDAAADIRQGPDDELQSWDGGGRDSLGSGQGGESSKSRATSA